MLEWRNPTSSVPTPACRCGWPCETCSFSMIRVSTVVSPRALRVHQEWSADPWYSISPDLLQNTYVAVLCSVWGPPLAEVQWYDTSNTAMCSIYATEESLISTQDYYILLLKAIHTIGGCFRLWTKTNPNNKHMTVMAVPGKSNFILQHYSIAYFNCIQHSKC